MAVGLALATLGGAGAALAFAAPGLLPGVPVALAAAGGFLLVTAGVLVAVLSFRKTPEPVPVIPAEVAFVTRTARPILAPERVTLPAGRRVSTRRPEEQEAMARLDDEIRELTRQINKAGVMLATGQISHQGYASYVGDLKKRRGDLEASRVRLELHRVE